MSTQLIKPNILLLSPGQTIATYRNIVVRNMLCAFDHPFATCCDMLAVVGSNLKMVKSFVEHLWMLHDVVVVWPGSSNSVAPGHVVRYSTRNMSQHVSSGWPKRVQHVAPNNVTICCVQLLRSFGRSLQMLGQQCRDMSC